MNVINLSITGSADVTLSDTVDVTIPSGKTCRAFHCNADGTVYVDFKGGQTNKKLVVKAGVCYPYEVKRFRLTNASGVTNAGDIQALY